MPRLMTMLENLHIIVEQERHDIPKVSSLLIGDDTISSLAFPDGLTEIGRASSSCDDGSSIKRKAW